LCKFYKAKARFPRHSFKLDQPISLREKRNVE